jgi:peptidyl-tRNA hydrolase, PTH1 family
MHKYLVIGLGNIGAEYNHTRHNVGFDLADAFVAKFGGSFQSSRLAYMSAVKVKGRQVTVLKPTTYMNLSGTAMKYWLGKENIAVENSLVLVDDIALPLERIRLRGNGSAGGHNGLKSVAESLGNEQYPRLRFGIGSNFTKGSQVDFVLGRWDPSEEPLLKAKISKCTEVIESFIFQGLANTMSSYNNLVFTL